MAVSLNGALSGATAGASLGSMIPGVGTVLGAIGGGIMGLFGGKKDKSKELAAQQQEYNKELMGLQANYNEKAAQANQQRNMEMWNYTSYPNQLKKMVEAGLSPGLMYGQAGAGGSTAGAQAAGTGIATGNQVAASYQASIQGQMMNEQLNNIAADTALKAAEAKNKEADTENKTTIERDLISAQTELTKINTLVGEENISNLQAATKNIEEQTRILAIDKEIKEETKEDLIKITSETLYNTIMQGFMMGKDVELKDSEIQKIHEEIKYIAYGAYTSRIGAEASQQMVNLLKEIEPLKLSQKDKEIQQQWVKIGVDGVVGVIRSIADFMPWAKIGKLFNKGK